MLCEQGVCMVDLSKGRLFEATLVEYTRLLIEVLAADDQYLPGWVFDLVQ